MLFGYDPMSRLAASPLPSSTTDPIPSHTDLVGRACSLGLPCIASQPNVRYSQSVQGARGSFLPQFALQGDGRSVTPLKCYNFPYPPRCSPSSPVPSPSPSSGRLSVNRPVTVTTDPFVLEKLLHTFQTMRSSVDNISQELRVLNTHLANLSRHFGALPDPFAPPQQDGPDYYQ